MSSVKIITTSDGSHSLFNEELNETYHSVHGAVQESNHVFIQSGLHYFIDAFKPKTIFILEIGFGTGLNALLTIKAAQQLPSLTFNYTTLEAFPLDEEVWSQLNYADDLKLKDEFHSLHSVLWEVDNRILPNFQFQKQHIKLQEVIFRPSSFDIIFFDAFAPNKQPELWEIDALKKVTEALNTNGVFVTYCAKGQLKRDLKSLGLIVQTIPGPPGKKEMVRAIKSFLG
ncbi:MAG TPA: tRNA (5-methylaminomethyl-2-thiouridine)(34)-methyltransferase MnmD [Chryseolinea sp.]|nr:tRNA (5-methylaminomethyl-2-thiouridine)(34)-methyltransferase MnmD [Chryseolinea sp.]HPH45509.1 tRNA (5-methylaminomethyl-2-thiouridine)(34)-methyltransferase MnmD [Chryseolinea sp.]HPM30782.1 tRNA (5-methylaminomethyl-2-thiouridine)(34)-methyltransferase MnmD [Chryseolinea sp.]